MKLSFVLFFSIAGSDFFAGNLLHAADSAETLSTIRTAVVANPERRAQLLTPLIRQRSNSDLAHWHLGEVQHGDDWLTVDEYVRARKNDTLYREYISRRTEVQKGHHSEFSLAGWCRRQKWFDAERLHLYRVLQSDSANAKDKAKSMLRLGLKNYKGRVLSQKRIESLENELDENRQSVSEWKPLVTKWIAAIEESSAPKRRFALAELRKVDEPKAISTMEYMLSRRSEAFAKEFVELLIRIPDIESTDSLVRQSLDSPWQTIRSQAVAALKDRQLHDHTPTLLDELNSQLDSQFRVTIDADGMVRRTHQVFNEDQDARHLTTAVTARGPQRVNKSVTFVQPGVGVVGVATQEEVRLRRELRRLRMRPGQIAENYLPTLIESMDRQKELAVRRQIIAQQEIVNGSLVERNLKAMNEKIKGRNARVFSVLSETTGQKNIQPTAVAWWDWWNDYNELYMEEKPNYAHVVGRSDPVQRELYKYDCFPKGTIVHTESGNVPIEKIQPGDRVLSQDLETGELAYKLILRRAVRPPSKILQVSFEGGETIRSTKGHAFWVNNVGWRMAKRLEGEHNVHALFGSGKVASISEESDSEPAFNLVVADFGTFFVGKHGLLVHGRTDRKPTTALVPGVLPEHLKSEL